MNRILRFFLGQFFYHLYHSMAWTYNGVAWLVSWGRWYRWIDQVEPYLVGNRILEVGFGTGYLQQKLLSEGKVIFGLDESRFMCNESRRRLIKSGDFTGSRLVRGKGENLPYQRGSFSTVIATFPSEYIFHPETVSECRRVLQGDGCLVILVGVTFTGKNIADQLLRWLYGVTGESPAENQRTQLAKLFKESGFEFRIEQIPFEKNLLWVLIANKVQIL